MTARLRSALVGAALLASCEVAEAQTARLTVEQVLGASATSLAIDFGSVDAQCIAQPAPGVTCSAHPSGSHATWYGAIQLRVRITAFPGGTSQLTGQRLAGGSMPPGRLVDGPSGVPATAYPTAPAAPLTLATALGNGNTLISRSVGVRVLPADSAGAWSTQVVYSLVVE